MEGKPYSRRLHDLESRFRSLEPMIPDGPQKEGLSVIHGMLQEIWRSLRPGAAESSSELTLQDIADLYKSAPAMDGEAVAEGLPVGSRAPDFTLKDASGQPFTLSEHLGRPLVLVFYPLDWSPTCSDQLSLYQAELEEFRRRNAFLVGISVDSIYSHGAWAAVRGLTFPLLADFCPQGEVARRYRVWRPNEGFSERALYVVDAEGVIRYVHVSPRLSHVPDIYELFRVLDEIASREPAVVGGS